jgi:hypothetical protein
MGLKSGSSGDPLEEDEGGEASEDSVKDRTASVGPVEAADDSGQADRDTTTMSSSRIPYKFRRESVNEGRDQVPFFLREHVRDGEDELREAVETNLGEDVPISDVREAAMLVAQAHPDLVVDELREWGFDYE